MQRTAPPWQRASIARDRVAAVEYALLVALTAFAIVGGIHLLGPSLRLAFDEAPASI